MGQEGAWRSFDGTHQEDAFRYAEDVGQTSLVCTGQLESLLIYSILVSTLLMYVMRVRNTVYSLYLFFELLLGSNYSRGGGCGGCPRTGAWCATIVENISPL